MLGAGAQTMFIPDTYLRTWLNNAKPGSVDVNGNCDTVAWNAVPPSTVNFTFSSVPDGGSVDLTGIQFLKMNTLNITDGSQSNISVTWPGYPRAHSHLTLRNINVQLFTPSILPLDPGMDIFECDACGLTNIPAFNGPLMHFINTDLSGQTVTVPNAVSWLTLTNDNLSTLPLMPNVTSLSISDNPLTSWANLPTGLVSLTANNVGLTLLPPLPVNLGALSYANNGLTALPALPAGLGTLFLQNNALTSIPALPPNLNFLVISKNPITTLPSMPNSLAQVTADSCALVNIGTLSTGLTSLSLNGNPLVSLPTLPANLQTLRLKDCEQLGCLPVLPQNLVTLQLYNSGVTCLPNIAPNLNTLGGENNLGIAEVYCTIANSPCTTAEPKITGTVFSDTDSDGVFDVGEFGRPHGIVMAEPGDYLAGSDVMGRYIMPVDIGSFTADGMPSLYEPITTAPYAVTFTALGQEDSLNHVGYETVPGIFDLTTHINGSVVRPGFNTGVWVTVHNAGTEGTDALVQLTFDAELDYVASSYAPNSVNANVIEWNTGYMYPGTSWTVYVTLYTPITVPLGTMVTQEGSATATPAQTDFTPADNIALYTDSVVGSYDPNDKRVLPELLSPQQILDGARVEYRIRFQNTGTYPAERVLITDTLSEDLQWTTMQEIASSHEHTWYISHGVLHVLFENINLPDSTSDEPNSHGFITFTMVPDASLMLGESVGNTANIYFDFNEPVITNEAVFTVDATANVVVRDGADVSIWPNPVEDLLTINASDGIDAIEITDVTGRVVMREQTVGTQTSIDVVRLAKGSYTLRFVDGSMRSVAFVKH